MRWIYNVAKRATLAGVGVICGCAVGPNFTAPRAPARAYAVPSVPAGEQSFVYGADVASDWYRLFRSPKLNSLVQAALRGSPDLEAARRSLAAAQYEERAVAGALYPQVEIDARAQRERVNGSYLFMPIDAFHATANQFALGPSLAYDLDVFGGIRRSIESQAAQTAEASHEALNVYITLVSDVVLTAFNIASANEQIDATRRLIDDLRDQYQLTRTLERAGRATESDTLQASAQLESVRASLPALEKQRDIYIDALLRLLGRNPADAPLAIPTLHDFALPRRLPVSVPSQLVRHRPDVLEAQDRLHQASAEIGVAEAARFPSFAITGQYAQQSNLTSNLLTKPAQIWALGLGVTLPIFEGGTLSAREKEARQRYLQVAAQYRSTVTSAFNDVADAIQAVQHDSDRYMALELALKAAQANRDLARTLFARGKVNELTVLIAQEQYQNAILDHVRAAAERFADVAMLFHALGGGWWSSGQKLELGGSAAQQAGRPGATGSQHER